MKKIISVLLAVLVFTGFATFNTFAEKTESVDAPEFEVNRLIGLTTMEINISKSGSTANINVYTQCSQTASQIGFKDGYIEKKINGVWSEKVYVSTYYGANTYYNSKTLGYTMTSGVTYRVVIWHYCIINGVEYKQQQTSVEFSL